MLKFGMEALFNQTRSTSQLASHQLVSKIAVSSYCQTLGLVLRLRVDFVLPLSQEEQQQQEQQQQPPTKIYQWGVY